MREGVRYSLPLPLNGHVHYMQSYFLNLSKVCNNSKMYRKNILNCSFISRSNAVSVLGHVICWFLQIWFIVTVGILNKIYQSETLREVATILKMTEFCLFPLVQILTSPLLQKYMWIKLHVQRRLGHLNLVVSYNEQIETDRICLL